MRYILALLLLISIPKTGGGCLKLDIVLVGDYSGSVAGYESFIVDAFQAFASRFEISENDIKLGVITFGESATMICPLTSDKAIVKQRLDILRHAGAMDASTDITSGLMAAMSELQGNGRYNTQKMIILVSDGFHNLSGDPEALAATIKRTGMIISTVVIADTSANRLLMESIATPGFYVESSYGTLIDELKALDLCL
jgi:Mg-chelatase subunit ChlD